MEGAINVRQSVRIFAGKGLTVTMGFSPAFSKRVNNMFGLGGAMQQYIDHFWLTQTTPYVPVLTTALRQSAFTNSVIGSGWIIWRTPYARRQYMENPGPGVKQSAPLAGKLWAERAKADKMGAFRATIAQKFGVEVKGG